MIRVLQVLRQAEQVAFADNLEVFKLIQQDGAEDREGDDQKKNQQNQGVSKKPHTDWTNQQNDEQTAAHAEQYQASL